MSKLLTRRELLKSAGGITFLTLVPTAQGLFAAPKSDPTVDDTLPLFTALPYVQPGVNSKLMPGAEQMVLAWQTQSKPAEFEVVYGASKKYGQTVTPIKTERYGLDTDDGENRFNYAATLSGLDLGKTYYYRVTGNKQTIAEGYFTTRKPRSTKTRFVSFGDNSFGDISDRAIAYYAYQAAPDFVMNTGDNVYDGGLDNEYARYFFPVYNADVAGPRIGAPLLRSIPFYTIIANHDVHSHDANKNPVADFSKDPDSLAYYTNMHLPMNGPTPAQPTSTIGNDGKAYQTFLVAAGDRFPKMANYSFDYGDAHFLCLDANVYIDPTNADLQKWISDDLASTDAIWKFVVYHHPAFNVGAEHYAEQHMRVLAPLFEQAGVDFVLNGHEHTYQRTRPIKFEPTDLTNAKKINSKSRLVPGKFTVDMAFDGQTVTKPQGVMHITTGAGGKHLYDFDYTNAPEKWLHAEDNNVAYVATMITDRHSLTVFDLNGKMLTMSQIDERGHEIDKITVTKG